MRILFVAFIMIDGVTGYTDDLEALKAAARAYVVAMNAALTLPETPDCSQTIEKAREYAAAKTAYYNAARRALPVLLQMVKGEKTDSRYGKELTEIFRGFGEGTDQVASIILEAKLDQCPTSEKRDEVLIALERARQSAEQFIRDFRGLEGT